MFLCGIRVETIDQQWERIVEDLYWQGDNI